MIKIARALQREFSFSSAKSNELTDQQNMFCFNHESAFYKKKNVKMWRNDEFNAQTLTGSPTRNSRCHVLASHALNMSFGFGQWACSIERCLVRSPYHDYDYLWFDSKSFLIDIVYHNFLNNFLRLVIDRRTSNVHSTLMLSKFAKSSLVTKMCCRFVAVGTCPQSLK